MVVLAKMSTRAIVDNLSNETYDPEFSPNKPEPDDCYRYKVVVNGKYVVIARLCDLYVTGVFKTPISQLKTLAQSRKSNRLTNTYKPCLDHVRTTKLPSDPNTVRLQLRATETAKSRLVRFKVIVTTPGGPMADYWYVDLNHATVYSETAELIVNKTMEQICSRTNVDIGNHIRTML